MVLEKLNPLTRGNEKLDNSIFGWSITPIKSCLNCASCKDTCYAIKSYNQYPNVKTAWDRNLELAKSGDFQVAVIGQLERARIVKSVRIHVAGAFISQKYIDQWVYVASKFPELNFYGYTKVMERFDFSNLTYLDNVNIINSIATDGKKNYGDQDRIDELLALDYVLCPATVKGNKVTCGKDCHICITEEKVCFIEH